MDCDLIRYGAVPKRQNLKLLRDVSNDRADDEKIGD
jgi:hypothetical protein